MVNKWISKWNWFSKYSNVNYINLLTLIFQRLYYWECIYYAFQDTNFNDILRFLNFILLLSGQARSPYAMSQSLQRETEDCHYRPSHHPYPCPPSLKRWRAWRPSATAATASGWAGWPSTGTWRRWKPWGASGSWSTWRWSEDNSR